MNNQKNTTQSLQKEKSGEQKHISASIRFFLLLLYISFCTSFLCAIIPISSASVFALMICICILAVIYTYRVRGKKAKNKMVIAHTSYMISTFWRANILMAVTSFFGLLYMLVMVDYEPLEECANTMLAVIDSVHLQTLQKILGFCGELVVAKNSFNLYIAAFIAFFPPFIYVSWRCLKGILLLIANKN